MTFFITIKHERRNIRLKVALIYKDKAIEKYEVSGRNRSITLQTNRPVLEARGLKRKPADWKLIAGPMHNMHLVEEIKKAILEKLREDN